MESEPDSPRERLPYWYKSRVANVISVIATVVCLSSLFVGRGGWHEGVIFLGIGIVLFPFIYLMMLKRRQRRSERR